MSGERGEMGTNRKAGQRRPERKKEAMGWCAIKKGGTSSSLSPRLPSA
jgi:hypothetical protein